MSGTKTSIAFLVIAYGCPEHTEKCIRLLQRYFQGRYDIVLFDNHSPQSLNSLARKLKVQYLASEENLGFAGGVNFVVALWLRKHSADWICLVNTDAFVNEQFAQELQKQLPSLSQQQKLAAFQPLLFQDEALTQPENFGVFYFQSGLTFQNRSGKIHPSTLLNGAFLFLRGSVVHELLSQDGYIFVPEYFYNAEDIELSLRLLSRGYRIQVNSRLRVQHLGSQSLGGFSEQSFFQAWRNVLWTKYIVDNKLDWMREFPSLCIGQLLLLFLAFRHRWWRMPIQVGKEFFLPPSTLSLRRKQFQELKTSVIWKKYIQEGVFPSLFLR